jgi:4-hydroxy-tetrahydrodipicolinate synthase
VTGLLDGLVLPLVTPMLTPGQPSAAAATPFLKALAAAGVRRLMLLGSNGEGPLIPAGRTGPFIAGIVDQWRRLAPGGLVLANVSAAGTAEAGVRAEHAIAAGADALVLSPPTYFRHRDDEIVAHYAALARYGPPVIAYNAPRYAAPLTRPCVDALAGLPHVAGVKDSSGDPTFVEYLIAAGFATSQGDERHLTDALRAGARGITPGVANLAPRLFLDLLAAHEAGDTAEADRLQALTTRLIELHRVRPGVPSVKALLAHRGLCPPHSAPPLAQCTPAETAALVAAVEPVRDYLLTPAAGG